MITDAARLRATSNRAKRAEANLAAIESEVLTATNQLRLLAEAIATEAQQPKTLGGKLQRIANTLRATVEGRP